MSGKDQAERDPPAGTDKDSPDDAAEGEAIKPEAVESEVESEDDEVAVPHLDHVADDEGGEILGTLPAELSVEPAVVPSDPLGRYLAEIRRHPLLTADEEHELAVRYKEYGDVEAAYRLVTGNLRLVVMIARRYERAFKSLLDLIQEGNIGLMEAVKKFDPYRGIRFPSYAVWWIRAYVIRFIMNNFRLVKMGTTQAQRKLFFNLRKEMDRLTAEGFDVSPKLIASRLDVKPSEVVEMQQRMGSSDVSVDAPFGDDGEGSMLDVLPSGGATTEEAVANAQYQQDVGELMHEFGATLAGKDKTIFEERLLAEDPRTLAEIGETYGVSRERVRQIEERLKERLKDYMLSRMSDLATVEIVRPRERKRRAAKAAPARVEVEASEAEAEPDPVRKPRAAKGRARPA